MLLVHSGSLDTTNFEISDQLLAVNSCGLNTTQGEGHAPSDAVYVRRPEGRKDYQLLYLCKGRAEHYWQNAWHTLRAGQAFLYWPGMPQYYLYRAQSPLLCKWVHFSGSMAKSLLTGCGFSPQEPILTLGEDQELNRLYDRIIQETQRKPPLYQEMCRPLLYQLIVQAGRRQLIARDEESYQSRDRLMRAVEHLHAHYQEPLSIDACAAQCGMSRFHFAHAFRSSVGLSPYAYLTQLRMDHARELLVDSDLSVSAVARACSYDNPLYFSRVFSRHFQAPPTECRKKHAPAEESIPMPEGNE